MTDDRQVAANSGKPKWRALQNFELLAASRRRAGK
jgi:hypothetical protein